MWKFTQDADEEQHDYLLEGTEGLCSLSPMQRIYGFAAFLLAGLVCMFLSLIVFAKPIKFALLFTLGNVMAVGSKLLMVIAIICEIGALIWYSFELHPFRS